MSKDTNEYITDAVARIVANDQDLYRGTRYVIMSAYVEAYDHDIAPIDDYRVGHHANARVRATDALAEYLAAQVDDDRDGHLLAKTLIESALDLVDCRDLTRRILDSIGENNPLYHDLNQNGKNAIILDYAREATGAV